MSRTPQTLLTIAASLASLALVAGCGSDEKSATPASSAAAAKPGTASLYGTYERDVTKADIDRTEKLRSEVRGEKPKPDHVVLTIAEGDPQSTLTATGSDGFTVAMDVDASAGGKLVLSSYVDPGKGAFCGPDIPAPASYTWQLNGRTLVLTAHNDPCADRDSTLNGKWRRR